jgi:tetratricopeptide (TPR) repeat protein
VNHVEIILRDVEIGGMHLRNVKAVVTEGQNAPLLLGQTAISELGRVTIDGNRLVIHSAENRLTRQQIIKLEEQANRYMEAESFAAAIECFVRIDEAIGLSEEHLKNLCYCCFMNHDLERCIQYGLRWIKEYDGSASLVNKIEVYNCLADSYFSGLFDYDNALLWYQKELEIMVHPSISKYYVDTYKILLGGLNNSIADCYCYKGRYNFAITYYKQAVKLQCESMNVKMEKVKRGEVQDEFLAYYLYNYALCLYKQKEDSDGDEVMKLAALCGDKEAIRFCGKYNINYQTKSSKLFE